MKVKAIETQKKLDEFDQEQSVIKERLIAMKKAEAKRKKEEKLRKEKVKKRMF